MPTMNSCPKVSVLMPVYNGERYLREAIESILGQRFTKFELLIIDDGSTDRSWEIIRSYDDPRIRLIKNVKNIGLIKTLNSGLALARGEYLARQDQDDISHPARLEKQLAYLNSHPEIALIGTKVNPIDWRGRKIKAYGYCIVSGELAIRWYSMFNSPFAHPSVMMRTEIVRDMGGYDERFPACEDYDLFSRIIAEHGATNLEEALIDYRCHPASMTPNITKEHNLIAGRIMRRSFSKYLGIDPPDEWIELWLNINNLGNFNVSINVNKLIQYIESAYDKFVSLYPIAQDDGEIKKHISQMLIRIAYNSAQKDRLASIYCFYRVLRRDPQLASAFFPKYFISLVLGRHRILVSRKLREYQAGLNRWRSK